jgi:AAA+ ATPase superfamily predicted ATPase
MRFFDREEEIGILRDIRRKARSSARFTVVTGRRRVGKTQLIKRAMEDEPYLYLYVSRKAEKDLCRGFQEEIASVLGLPTVGDAERFETLFKVVVEESKKRPVSLVIDEFQEFYRIDESVFSSMADIWDDAQKNAKLNLVVCGSVNRLMSRIFKDESEPLYGRNTGLLHVEPFKVSVLKKILEAHAPNYANEDLLALWTMTGGVARYVEQLMDDGAFTREKMLASVFRRDSPYLDEGMSILVQEFGKEYGTYFSIMSAIASGRTEHSQIKNEVGTEVGAFLSKLENDYGLIRRRLPIFASPKSKQSIYEIDDCFFRYWFRFVWKNMYLKELQRFDVMRDYAERDYEVFSGHALEKYFQWKFIEERKYTRMDAWWDRKGENEIDLVCDDEVSGRLDFFEVKRNPGRIDVDLLKHKADAFFAKNPALKSRAAHFAGLSLNDM